MKGLRWIATGLLLSTSIIACKEEKKDEKPAGPARGNANLQADGFVVRTTSLSENLEVPGTILPYEQTEIRPEISGRVVQLNINEGNFVQKGSLLVKLFDADLQAQLKKLQVQLQIAEKTAERYQALLKINGVSQQEYDLSELDANNLRADIDLVKVNIAKTEIRAPFNGRMGLRQISLGAYITPTTLISTISQVGQLKMEFAVPEKYSDEMRKGRTVTFTVAGANQKFNASILATESLIEANTRTLKVRTVVGGNNPLLVPGAFAKVALQLGENDEALIIPTQAVIPQARNKRVILYRGGVAQFQEVKTGIRDSSFVQITEGLQKGDTVVTTALLSIRENSKIKLAKVQ
ncbi:efflux RND transporter periplasmic adaptor subunit [Pseudobacter ginsenosidimutans]|uniref:Membrane fusion protein (Multidrug efflux system) n=1 Tax=Pseudobacter ginsenosidimutans TaxID=661488 RepID=A0A4Q7N4R8_9BACT|nr:efflux RND transporter periplasmic adaptor subunit [Pseudobacter ginsenosidimutans]QEC44524.1 efflux RND transporter periplasmic adaptor subunit [Pseudobacter ginsenosidimutans]RZS76001.1 membrane fusion protein (multidrug efflux system) [Pseudobacter ginsenosidimutans]